MDNTSPVSQLSSPAVHTLIVGMSGIGKSWLARQLVANGRWRRVSIDTEIQSKQGTLASVRSFRKSLHSLPTKS